jgi:hypothetical protein
MSEAEAAAFRADAEALRDQQRGATKNRLEISGESDDQSVDDAGKTLNDGTPTTEQTAALKEYQSGDKPVNDYLRGEGEDPDGSVAETVGHLDDALRESTINKDVTVYRGQGLTDSQVSQLQGLAATGGTFVDPAFCSTSLSKSVGEGFVVSGKSRTGALFEIEVPAGSSGAYVNRFTGNDISDPIGGELELLMPRKQSLRVVSVSKTGDRRILVKLRAGQ